MITASLLLMCSVEEVVDILLVLVLSLTSEIKLYVSYTACTGSVGPFDLLCCPGCPDAPDAPRCTANH